MNKFFSSVYKVLKSKKFFYIVIGLLILQAAWFALTIRYPMAFDENYHFGVIQLFSHQWTPFISSMPAGSGSLGDVTRYDSYLFHYLMSFPYRLISIFVHQEVAQIIILRFINIGLFVGGLFLYRNLFRRFKVSNGLINFSLFMLVLIPVAPFLAATINYDNLIFLLIPLVVGLALTCRDQIINKKTIPAISFLSLLIIGGLSSLVKYAFLPIFVAVILYLTIIFFRTANKTRLMHSLVTSFKSLKLASQIVLLAGLALSTGLLVERYGVNIVEYHNIQPDCAQVQTVEHCSQFGPWQRNLLIEIEIAETNPDPYPTKLNYPPMWASVMMTHLYFAINYNYDDSPPLPIPIYVASLIGALGLILCIVFWKSIIRIDRRLILLATVVILYTAAVFYTNFTGYLHYRTAQAMNGRYLLIIFPMLFIWLGLAYKLLINKFSRLRSQIVVTILVVAVTILMLQGGGALTHLLSSQPDWYWQNQTLIDFNIGLKKAVSLFIIGS